METNAISLDSYARRRVPVFVAGRRSRNVPRPRGFGRTDTIGRAGSRTPVIVANRGYRLITGRIIVLLIMSRPRGFFYFHLQPE